MMERDDITTKTLVILMHVEDNKSYRDIADELNIDYFDVTNILNGLSNKELIWSSGTYSIYKVNNQHELYQHGIIIGRPHPSFDSAYKESMLLRGLKH